jgi:anti-sigma factor RsiW
MNDCANTEMRDRLPDFVHGTLDAAAEARVASHLRECADCAAEVELIRVARTVLRPAQRPIDVAGIAAALPVPSEARRLAIGAVPSRISARRWRAAAAVLVAIGGAATIWLVAENPRRSAPAERTAALPAHPVLAGDTQGLATPQGMTAVGLSLAGGFEGLSDEDLGTLLEELDRYEAFPEVDLEADVSPLDAEGAL